jgi:hypothetical protein
VRKPERVSELLARADPSGQQLLEDAVRLAHWRIAAERQRGEGSERRTDRPSNEPSIEIPYGPFFTGIDLLRAVLASGGALLDDLFAGIDREEACAVDAARWRSILVEAPPPADLPLAGVWRGRWAIGCTKIPRFDAQGVLGALPPWCLNELVGYSRAWQADELAEGKVFQELHTNQQVIAGWGDYVPPASLDRQLLELPDHMFVAWWLCQRPEAEDTHGKHFELSTLLATLATADEEDIRKLWWSDLDPWFENISEDPEADKWLELVAATAEGRVESWLRERHQIREDPFYLRYVGSPTRVQALLELDAALP